MLALAVAVIACAGSDPEPGAVRLAALTAGAAADVLSDLAAVDDPDAAGVRDAFHAANVTALESARLANESAPRATRAAYALSLDAAEAADTFAEALSAAIKARDELATQAEASRSATETAVLIAEVVQRETASPRLEAEMERLADEYIRLSDAYLEWSADSSPAATDALREAIADGHSSAPEWEAHRAESERRSKPSDDALLAYDAAVDTFRQNGEALYRARNRLLLRVIDDRSLSDLVIEGLDAEEGLDPETVAQVEAEAQASAQAHAATLADTTAKVRAAEDWRPAAITAYQTAASAWRGLLRPGGEE